MKPYLMLRNGSNEIEGCWWLEDTDIGPAMPMQRPPDGFVLVDAGIEFTRTGRRNTESAYLVGGLIEWKDHVVLEDERSAAMVRIDGAGEVMRLAVINHMPTQTEEYRQALQQARDWRAAGYPESEEVPAPADVASWAAAKWREGWTSRQAADDILATADRWCGILSTIRALRLINKEDVRNASTPAEVEQIAADMEADMRALALQLDLTITS